MKTTETSTEPSPQLVSAEKIVITTDGAGTYTVRIYGADGVRRFYGTGYSTSAEVFEFLKGWQSGCIIL